MSGERAEVTELQRMARHIGLCGEIASSSLFICTRTSGHKGMHAAEDVDRTCDTWAGTS